MADNNKNPRRTIWLSETEPLSHYDIWLSKNQHLNSEGEPRSDNNVLRPCDYIFKVWDCNEWHPIVGLNSTAVNKIDTVKDLEYNSTNPNTGHAISSYSYLEFHLPLFTDPKWSPAELFDAGTIGDAILEYVTLLEWKKIFEGDAFSLAFKLYIEGGDTNIDLLIDPAEADKLGGIYADEFEIEDIFPDSMARPTQLGIEDSYNWIALAKYKLLYDDLLGNEDYNLYISAKDIINVINKYQDAYQDEPGLDININSLEGILKNSPTIGVLVAKHEGAPSVKMNIWGSYAANNAGKILKIKDNPHPPVTTEWDLDNNIVDWTTEYDIVIEGTGYTTDNTRKYLSCLNGNFNWETSIGNTYYGSPTIYINPIGNVISIMPYTGGPRKVYLCSENLSVSWQPVDTGTNYIEGVGISINNTNNSININTNNAIEGLVLSYDGHGDVEWITVLSGGVEEYDAGDGIEITPSLGNKIIKGNIKECDLNGYNSGFSANTSIEFRAPTPEGAVLKNIVTLNIDGGILSGGSTYDLLPYTYTKIDLAMNGTIDFVIDGQTSYVNGNPIYVILSIPDKTSATYTINIKDSLDNDSDDFISINNALVNGSSSYTFGCDVTKFLITMQFGIVKIEPLGYIESNETEPEPVSEPVE